MPPTDDEIEEIGHFNDAVQKANDLGAEKYGDIFSGVIVRDGNPIARTVQPLTADQQKSFQTLFAHTTRNSLSKLESSQSRL